MRACAPQFNLVERCTLTRTPFGAESGDVQHAARRAVAGIGTYGHSSRGRLPGDVVEDGRIQVDQVLGPDLETLFVSRAWIWFCSAAAAPPPPLKS